MKTLIELGADAFVIGEQKFGLRLPGEFNREDVRKAVNLAHEHDKKVYVAVNGIFHNYHLNSNCQQWLSHHFYPLLGLKMKKNDFDQLQFLSDIQICHLRNLFYKYNFGAFYRASRLRKGIIYFLQNIPIVGQR